MKSMKRRLLSLLLALALVCSLVPGALAANPVAITASPSTIGVNATSTLSFTASNLQTGGYNCVWTSTSSDGGAVQFTSGNSSTFTIGSGQTSATPSVGVKGTAAGTVTITATVTNSTSGAEVMKASGTVTVQSTSATPNYTLTINGGNSSYTLTGGQTLTMPGATLKNNSVLVTGGYTLTWNMAPVSGYTQPSGDSINSSTGVITTTSAVTTTRKYNVTASATVTGLSTAVTSNPVTVTVNPTSTSSDLTLSGLTSSGYLSLYSSTTTLSSPVYASVTGLTNSDQYDVVWTSSNDSVYLTSNSSLSGSRTAKTAVGGYIYAYATTANASATVTVQLCHKGTNTPVTGYSTRSFVASVGAVSNNFTLTRNPSSTSTVYLWSNYNGYYNDYYGYTYDDAYAYYRQYGVWPSWWNNGSYGYNRTANFYVTPVIGSTYTNLANNYNISYSWTLSNSNNSSGALSTSALTNPTSYPYGGSSCTVDGYYLYGNTSYTLTCTATAYPKNEAQTSANTIRTSTSWTIRTDYYNNNYGSLSASVTMDQGTTYYLNSTTSYTTTSVIDQLNSQIRNYYYSSSNYLSSISFSNTTSNGTSLSSSTGSYSGSTTSNFSNLYVNPTTSAISSTSTATFNFTATDYAGYRYSGTLTVNVKPGVSSGGSLSLTGTQGENLLLSASDFSSWWNRSYSSGSLRYVQFTSASGGNVYSNYSTGSRSSVVSSTGATQCYVNPNSNQTGINTLTFVPSSSSTASATLNFTAYGTTSSSSSSTVARTGTVNITLKAATVQNVTVSYSSTGSAVPFSYSDFYYSNTAVQTSTYITFGTPSSGSLTASGAAVSSTTRFSFAGSSSGYQNISTITYTPASGFSGVATVPFYAYGASGNLVANGTVRITVTQPVQQPTQPTTPAISFKDVPNNSNTSWYYSTVARLVSAKIVSGYEDGTFRPNGSVTNGEALKLIMLAAGFSEQPNAADGAAWADNYRKAAVNAGLITDDQIATADLGKAMNRNTIASIAAKALKLTPVTDSSSSPFADSKDQWVLALNKAGIIQGTTESSGTTYFYGTQSLTRAQICLIIERVMNYRQTGSATTTATPSTTTPSTTTPSTSTPASNEKPAWLNT